MSQNKRIYFKHFLKYLGISKSEQENFKDYLNIYLKDLQTCFKNGLSFKRKIEFDIKEVKKYIENKILNFNLKYFLESEDLMAKYLKKYGFLDKSFADVRSDLKRNFINLKDNEIKEIFDILTFQIESKRGINIHFFEFKANFFSTSIFVKNKEINNNLFIILIKNNLNLRQKVFFLLKEFIFILNNSFKEFEKNDYESEDLKPSLKYSLIENSNYEILKELLNLEKFKINSIENNKFKLNENFVKKMKCNYYGKNFISNFFDILNLTTKEKFEIFNYKIDLPPYLKKIEYLNLSKIKSEYKLSP